MKGYKSEKAGWGEGSWEYGANEGYMLRLKVLEDPE